LSTGAQAGVIVGVIGGVVLFTTLPIIIFWVYMHRQQKKADKAAVDHPIEQALEQASTQPALRKTQWTESIEAVERQRSLAMTTTTVDTTSETSVAEFQRKGLLDPSLPKISIMSVIVKPNMVSTFDLEQGQRRVGIEATRETESSLAQRHHTELRAWHTAAVGQWMF